MKKLLMLIGALIMCDAYGEVVYWMANGNYVPTAINSCTAGGNITKPTDPTKSGYRFMGWQNKTGDPEFAEAVSIGSKDPNGSGQTVKNWNVYVQRNTNNITITGEARCSSTTGTASTTSACGTKHSNPVTSDTNVNDNVISTAVADNYCWCRITGINGVRFPDTDWLYVSSYMNSTSSTYICSKNCASTCNGIIYGSFDSSANYVKARKCLFRL